MEYNLFGNTGIRVSKICLGMMSYGTRAWSLDIEGAKPIVEKAIDLGVNFFDTANVYSRGISEEITGELLKEYRDNVVVATKIRSPMGDGVNDQGLNRFHMTREIQNSLKRLDMEYVELYQIHRWDYRTDIRHVMRSLNQLIDEGLVLHIGASSMFAWQLAQANAFAEHQGLEGFSSMQNHYNAIYREEEREVIPYCINQQMAIIPWSPLARGQLARPFTETTTRKETDNFQKQLYTDPNDEVIINEIQNISSELDVPMAQISLAWMLSKPGITSPIVGATKMKHLEDAVAATELQLDQDYIRRIDELYTTRPIKGHSYGGIL